jgi:hypothetical protein
VTTPPDWAVTTPNVEGIHGPLPERGGPKQPPFTWEQMQSDFFRIMQAFIEKIAMAFGWIDIFGDDGSFDFLVDWSTDVIDTTTAIIDNIVNTWLGIVGSWSLSDSASAQEDQATTIAALSAAVADLQALYGQAQTNASLYVVDFSTYPNTANLPSIFTQTYSGAGTGTYGVSGGRARVYPVNNASRSASGIFTVGTALTDYQIVGGVWTSSPEDDGLGNRGYSVLQCRSNTTGTTKIYARFGQKSLQLRCVVAGAETIMKTIGVGGTGTFRFKTNTLYYLMAGTPGGIRNFEVREGSPTGTLALDHVETGTTSQFGADFRSGGIGAQWFANSFATIEPGAEWYWLFGDNIAPSSLGSTFRARKTSGAVNAVEGDFLIPNSYTVERITNDLTWTATGNKVTVTIEGTYLVVVNQNLASGLITNNVFRAVVFRDTGTGPVIVARGPAFAYSPVGSDDPSFGIAVAVYCAAGDVIQPGYYSSGLAIGALVGETTGTGTYFEVVLLNRSLS